MRLTELVIENVCQHRSLSHQWHPALNAIIGPNGAGKSNLLMCVEAALTGDFGAVAGSKGHNVSQAAQDGEPSRIVLRLEHGDRKVEVQRGLRGARSVLIVDGGAAVIGDQKVTAALSELLGTTPDVLAEMVIARQRKIFDFLVAPAARRGEIFAALFGTARVEKAYVALSKELAACPMVQASEGAAELAAQIEEVEGLLTAAATTLAGLAVDEAAVLRARRVIEDGRRRDAAIAYRQSEERRRVVLVRAIEEARLSVASLIGEQLIFQEAITALMPAVEAARQALADWATYRRQEARRTIVAKRRAELDRLALENVAPPPLDLATQQDCDLHDQVYDQINADVLAMDRLAEAVRKHLPCPTCGTPAVDLEERSQIVEAGRAEKVALMVRLEAAMRRNWDYWDLERFYKGQCERIAQLWWQFELMQGEDEIVAAPAIAEAECRAVVAELADFQKRSQNVARDHAGEAARLASLENEEQGQALRANATIVGPTEEEVTAAMAVVTQATQVADRRLVLRGQQAELSAAVARDRDRLARLQAEAAQAALSNSWRSQVESWREVVHRDGLQKLISKAKFDAVEDDVNGLLERFDTDFRVETTEDLSFRARFFDGRNVPAARLSCGQLVLLALAFRIAVNAAYAGELGLLVLDEPTDSLDARNIECLEIAIGRLREVTVARGLQCLIVTHERKLARLFDATLDLGGW